jgi:K+-sensing histidine kinase KdpD
LAIDIKKILQTLDASPDPIKFRMAAQLIAFAIPCTDKYLGGTWWSLLVALIMIGIVSFVYPIDPPRDRIRRLALARLNRIREWSFFGRLTWALLGVGAATVLAAHVSDPQIGKEFDIFLIPMFLVSFLFGLQISIVTWVVSAFAFYYFVIPPKDSFWIYSLSDFANLLGYFYLGLVTLAIPELLRVFSFASRADHTAP